MLSAFNAKMLSYQQVYSNLALASNATDDPNVESNALAEGTFLKAFVAYETFLEATFIHFCNGGSSLNGFLATSRLANCDWAQARAILKGSQQYLDWAKPQAVRERARLFLTDGEPITGCIDPRAPDLGDIHKIRNMIAHESPEAGPAYTEVLVRMFTAAPLFPMCPGQALRVRRRKRPHMSWGAHYLSLMSGAANDIAKKTP